LIMSCVGSVKYQIRFNGRETDQFVPSRGLRQGDPLSPYLFLLCSEGLKSLLKHEEEARNLIGVKVCRAAPAVSHLLFAHDSLILMRVDLHNAMTLRASYKIIVIHLDKWSVRQNRASFLVQIHESMQE
jgi:hypothetical protein